MKFRDLLLRLALIAAVIASLVFTYLIWFNPAHLERRATTNTSVKTSAVASTRQETHVFLPSAVYVQKGDNKRLLLRDSGRMSAHVHRAIQDWRISGVEPSTKNNVTDYAAMLGQNGMVEMVYERPITWQLFNKYYFKKSAVHGHGEFTFNRIFIDTLHNAVTLGNDANRHTWRVRMVKKYDLTLFEDSLNAATATYPVSEERIGTKEVPFYKNSVTVNAYTYMMDTQGASHYVNSLMGSGSSAPSAIDAKQIDNQTVYTMSNNNQRLAVDRNDSRMRYENFAIAAPAKGITKNVENAYDDLLNLSIKQMRGISFYGYDAKTQAATFRMTVAGLPIIGQKMQGAVIVTHTTASKRIEFSGDNLSVAIPTGTSRVTLPSTNQLYTLLARHGVDTSQIADIVLAYAWNEASDNAQVAQLTPTYFVKIGTKLYDYRKLVDGSVKVTDTATDDDAQIAN